MSDSDSQTAQALAEVARAIDRLAEAVEDGNRAADRAAHQAAKAADRAADIQRLGFQAVAVFAARPPEPGETKLAAINALMGKGPPPF